jgi:hypothetical protein
MLNYISTKNFLQMGKRWFKVCQNQEGISVASYFRVYENEDAVSHCPIEIYLIKYKQRKARSITNII